MEEEKLIRKKKRALNSSNKRNVAEACNDLATYYYKHSRYDDALEEYKNEAAICKELGLRMEWGTCNRMIGEMYMLIAEFDKALKYEERHLVVAKELNNLVEEQRAMATFGRIYLLQGQSTNDNAEAETSLKSAEKAFMKSLVLCEKLVGKINRHELMDMRSRLLLNIGVVLENLGHLDKAVDCIHKALAICSNHDLYDVQHQCYVTEASLFANKKKDFSKALACLNKALEVASRLEDKIIKTCETLSSKADILCKMSDYQSAKQVLLKAYKLKTPDDTERENIETNLRVVAAICYTEDLIISTEPNNHESFKKLYEKLGDGACHLQNYQDAISNYTKMLEHAISNGESGKSLIPIYVSLYQTYKDIGKYNEALEFYQKEYELIKNVPKEAFATLFNIAETLYLARKPYDEIENTCKEARMVAKELKTQQEIRILKCLLKYQQEYSELDKMVETKNELRLLGVEDVDNLETSEDEMSSAGGLDDGVTMGDDICLEDLTDLSDNDEDMAQTKKEIRKRGRGFTIKKNMKGETQLHVASISGNKLLVERLLAKGHPINARDNAGWLPLHEACIHGHREVAQILIDNGANINDRGGSNCDGITPLYDAASNGHLDVVELLLDKGALPTLKTDFGETPLDVLRKWRNGTILSKDDELLYNNICCRITNQVDKTEILNRSKSKTPVKNITRHTPPSTSKSMRDLDSPAKRRNVINSESESEKQLSDSSDSDSHIVKTSKNIKGNDAGVREYRNAISALRNRTSDVIDVEVRKNKKSALLDPDEVDDDWLDDDLPNRNKKRKLSDPLANVAKKPSYETSKDAISVDSDSEVVENISPKNNITPKIDSRENMRRRWKKQSTLLKAGFQRNLDESSNSGSETEYRSSSVLSRKNSDLEYRKTPPSRNESLSRKNSNENLTFQRHRSNENMDKNNMNFIQNINPNIVQPLNVIQPINIVQSTKNGWTTQTQIMPPAAVKVQIEDKVLLISLKLDTINKRSISWLVDEIKSRYFKLTGSRPVFSLMTSDGAILSEDDPLSLVLSSPELKTCITNYKASPAEERYLECCDALSIDPSKEIQQTVGRSSSTHRLSLGIKTLPHNQIRPLFRALTHQNITSILVPDNNITDDSMKYICDCLYTLKNLTQIDLSRNRITSAGVKMLLNMFEKQTKPLCKALESIDLSENLITNDGLISILKLSQYLQLRILKLRKCGFDENALNQSSKPSINFDCIEVIDLSENDVKQGGLSCLVMSLNPNVIVELDLDSMGVEGSTLGTIVSFLDSAKDLKLRKLGLSNWKMVDGQFMRIYRIIGRAKSLQTLSLKNNNLTFISLKKLLQRQPPVPQMYLEGCADIFKYSPDSDFQIWLPNIEFGRCIPEVHVSPVFKSDSERDSFKLFSKTWLNCFQGRGMIEHCDGAVSKFTAR